MSITKKHQCPSCGGYLSVDNDKQMYRCASCGSTYDFDYFREEKLLELGDTALSRGEFDAAVDAFKLYLKEFPHDFSANRGMMLAAARMHSIDDIISNDKPEEFSYDSSMVSDAVENALEEDKGYFTELGKVYSDKKNLADRYNEIHSLEDEKQKLEATIRLTDDSRYDYNFTNKDGSPQTPKSRFIINWLFTAAFTVIAISFVLAALILGENAAWVLSLAFFFGLFAAGVTIGNFVLVYPRVKEIDKIDMHIVELRTELSRLNEKIRTCESEAEKLSANIMRSSRDFVSKDRQITKEPVRENVSGIGTIRKHQCPSCGGGLVIDNDKQMYHCTFCGSTYDYEYFKEDRMHEAGETYISRSEFMAAIDAYKFTLKKDPHDFIALRGLMLAAANLSNMKQLEKESESVEFSYDSQIVSEVIAGAAEEDKKYFTEFGKLYTEKKKRSDCSKEIVSLKEKKQQIRGVIARNNIDRENYYVRDRYGVLRPPKLMFVLFAVLTAVWTLLEIFFVCGYFSTAASGLEHPEIFGWLALCHGIPWSIFAIQAFVIILPKVKKINNIDAEISRLYEESGMMNKKIRDLENESEKHAANIRKYFHDFIKMDRNIMSGKREG